MKRAPTARGGQDADITQPREYSLADPSTYLILASSTEGFSSGVSFLLLGLFVDDGDCGCCCAGAVAAATAGREAVVGGRPAATFARDGDDCPLFTVRTS